MKKFILIIFLNYFSINLWAQENNWEISHASNGNFNISSEDEKYKFTFGGRFTFDAANLYEDITPLSSGTMVKEVRLNAAYKIEQMNIYVEVDFAKNVVTLKDITLRYNFSDHNFLKIGHFVEPFSANYLTTTEKTAFIGRPATATALAPGRSLGISYRHYQKYFWFEAGIFGDDMSQKYQGKDGFGITGRLALIPIDIPNAHLHLAVSGSYRTGDSRGLDEDGSGKYNRKLNFTAGLQTSLDSQNFLAAYIGPSGTDSYGQTDLEDLENGGAKDQVQFGAEILDVYRKFYWQAEFITTTVHRILNKEKILYLERDGTLYPETWDDISYKYGDARPLNFYGYYIQASYLLFGDNFKYSRYSSTLKRLTKRSLQISARYNYTTLDDIEGEYINGKFYTDEGVNMSVAGGTTSAISASLNYIHNENLRFLVEYTSQKIERFLQPDENIGILQARLQILF